MKTKVKVDKLIIHTGAYVGSECRGVTVHRAPDTIELGVNIHPKYAVPLSSKQAIEVGMKLIEMAYQLAREGVEKEDT